MYTLNIEMIIFVPPQSQHKKALTEQYPHQPIFCSEEEGEGTKGVGQGSCSVIDKVRDKK